MLVLLAEKVKGKDFVGKPADRLEDVYAEVDRELKVKNVVYIEKEVEPTTPVTDTLVAETLAFLNFGEKESKNDKINNFLQKFNIIKKFEEAVLYFEYSDTEVNFDKIYTIAEIKEAAKVVIDLA
jgi:hypothetical protein